MKQIINRFPNNSILSKYYENDRGQIHGLRIGYYDDGNVGFKTNFINHKRYGLDTWWCSNSKISEQRYFL